MWRPHQPPKFPRGMTGNLAEYKLQQGGVLVIAISEEGRMFEARIIRNSSQNLRGEATD